MFMLICKRVKCAVLLFCVLGATSVAWGDSRIMSMEEMQETLQLIVQRSSANYEKINTWHGEMSFDGLQIQRGKAAQSLVSLIAPHVDSIDDINEARTVTRGTISFAVNQKPRQLLVKFHLDEQSVNAGERQIHAIRGGRLALTSHVSLVTPDYFVSFTPDVVRGCAPEFEDMIPPSAKEAVIDDIGVVARKHHGWTELVDPRQFYTFDGHRYHWEEAQRITEQLNEAMTIGFQSEMIEALDENGEKVHIWKCSVVDPNQGSRLEQEYVFNESVAYNPVLIVKRLDGIPRIEQQITYQQIDGCWLPERVKRTLRDVSNELTFERTVIITESELNKEIPLETFTLASMGLRDDDQVRDVQNDRTFLYRDGVLIDASGAPTAHLEEYRSLLPRRPSE